ncbi:MAG: hypothetical protein J7513_07385 [Solirubrobacteraceae bacterium]|nr:hypothetical protein [Solirubrobacteraceae bacterium]
MRRPLLLLPRPLDEFINREQARELLTAGEGAVALPGRIPYGALTRAPAAVRGGVASSIAWGLARQIPSAWRPSETVVVAYHAIQWPAIAALMARGVAEELWYFRWDQYEEAHDVGRMRTLLHDWNARIAEVSALTFCVSDKLVDLEHEAGRQAIFVGLAADAFPDGPLAPTPRGAELIAAARDSHAGGPAGSRPDADSSASVVGDGPVAVSLGHLGRRTDWAWLRGAVERVPELTLLLIGRWYEDEVGHDPDYRWLREAPQAVWLGGLDDADAAEVIAQADVGLVPFTVDPFNEAGLPTRILKYARLGRRTISPPLAGTRTWAHTTTFVDSPEAFAAALREAAGARHHPDAPLRAWALEQTAAKMNAPLHARLRAD